MLKVVRAVAILALLFSTFALVAQEQLPDSPKPQVDRPAFPTPDAKVPSRPVPPSNTPENTGTPETTQAPPPITPNIKTVPPGGATKQPGSAADELNTVIRHTVNFVQVPVTVKDHDGHLVTGLTKDNFTIYENGIKQQMRFFTSDPFAVSAAIVIDIGMADVALKRVVETFPALVGAFSRYDEVSIYTYGNTVTLQQNFVSAFSDRITAALHRTSEIPGRGSGPMVADSPMTGGPMVNGRPFDPSISSSPVNRAHNVEPSRVLNDAILRAAQDLSKRDRTRRKMIFVISDGREQGSTSSYSDVLKVLLSNEVSVYAVAVDTAAIPLYDKISKVRLPRQGYSNILPKYASATGGEVFTEFGRSAIERAYGNLTEQARNQYTIGYNSPQTASSSYHSIEVRVNRGGMKVVARDGYYPLPPQRQ